LSTKLSYTKRNLNNNNLTLPLKTTANYSQHIPLNMDAKTTLVLLSDTILATGLITKEVKDLAFRDIPENAKTIYTTLADTLYKHMLQHSDNFIAEQVLLNIAYTNNLETTQSAIIQFIQDKYLRDLPDTLRWIDGSGLSRMNLNTPRNLTTILKAIYLKAGEKRVFEALSSGGRNGTLINQFKSDKVFIYGKTGSVSNNYCLSGFLIGDSGKRYSFSIMNNNFMLPTKIIKLEVERFITSLKSQL
jgi:D-alanyl-D-alanine carboxypeptidase/D-alanyl-D-alanine-endopeptidase (penicillin-binding protein 4)